jgi:hypothetical protein
MHPANSTWTSIHLDTPSRHACLHHTQQGMLHGFFLRPDAGTSDAGQPNRCMNLMMALHTPMCGGECTKHKGKDDKGLLAGKYSVHKLHNCSTSKT